MKTSILNIIVLSSTLLSSSVFALDNVAYKEARKYQEMSVAGDENATNKAFDLFTSLVESNPNNALVLAYQGSMETIKGRDAWMPWRKMGYVDAGLDKIDKAIEMIESDDYQDEKQDTQWNSITTRLVAATTFLKLPDMFNRFQSGKDELMILLESDKFAGAAIEIKNNAYALAIKVAEKEGKQDDVAKYKKLLQK